MLKKAVTYIMLLVLPHFCTAQTDYDTKNRNNAVNCFTVTLCALTTAATILAAYMYRKQYKSNKLLRLQTKLLERKSRQLSKQKNELEKNYHSLEQLSLVARRTNNSIFITDIDGNILWINEAFVKNSGYKIDAMTRFPPLPAPPWSGAFVNSHRIDTYLLTPRRPLNIINI